MRKTYPTLSLAFRMAMQQFHLTSCSAAARVHKTHALGCSQFVPSRPHSDSYVTSYEMDAVCDVIRLHMAVSVYYK